MNPKTDPAFPLSRSHFAPDGKMLSVDWSPGLTQYAEMAARFHAALLHQDRFAEYRPLDILKTVGAAFNHADAFFAELAKRTKP